ncbi:molybdopterin-guanine dinucleotide biosynthesis protein B [Paenibacillus spongiae]|uniref:Molybdopterin-guanine dinucleotide biosynthesis protein B n=1 Tax=Paenibacillus spongiae TaxID=2909671 RepID=A0ABY5SF73_9BACL|nr:molybdopterin-guanine dinucleotide biosynthesis protein B [Paenibacillus spongiae]UVI31360.1 molybdopterin-guanine dinucleotide biosynthesis protein B [Paenibacillus spongiae]
MTRREAGPYILQIVGYKKRGKTTLVAALTRRLKAAGYSVGTIKHDAHDFTMDSPNTDTWKHQEAGADITAISSLRRSAFIRSRPQTLDELLGYMDDIDIVLVEGYKYERHPKLVLIRFEEDWQLLQELDSLLAAVVWPEINQAAVLNRTGDQALSDNSDVHGDEELPNYLIDDIDGLADFVNHRLHTHRKAAPLKS